MTHSGSTGVVVPPAGTGSRGPAAIGVLNPLSLKTLPSIAHVWWRLGNRLTNAQNRRFMGTRNRPNLPPQFKCLPCSRAAGFLGKPDVGHTRPDPRPQSFAASRILGQWTGKARYNDCHVRADAQRIASRYDLVRN